MKKRYIFIAGTIMMIGQTIFSYQSIIENSSTKKKLQEIKAESLYGKVHTTSPLDSVEYVTYQYKKKKKDFSHAEHQLLLLKQKSFLTKGGTTSQNQLAKIVATLSGRLLYGQNV